MRKAECQTDSQLKVLAPIMTRDVILPDTSRKVPMVMVPVPDSRTMMAFPWSTITQITEQQKQQQYPTMDESERQAIDILTWNEGIGILDGCDLKFRINQLGCLELLDSDDESDSQQRYQQQLLSIQQQQQKLNNTNTNNINNIINNSSKQRKTSSKIKPGASLLRDGPLIQKRSKPNSVTSSKEQVLLEKFILKGKLNEFKDNVNNWTVKDVESFIDDIPGCSGLGCLFKSHEICGKSLIHLDQKDLIDIINVKLGPAVKISNAISLLKSRS